MMNLKCKVLALTMGASVLIGGKAFAQVPSYVPTNGLVGWWPFNGNANDESGNGNNGTVNGATLTSDRNGVANKAYSFDGVNYIQVPHSASQVYPNGQSISFWFNRTAIFGNGPVGSILFSKGANISYGQNIICGDPSNHFAYHYIQGNYNNANQCYTNNNVFQNNSWGHYLVTNDLNLMKVYLNGVLISSCNVDYPSVTLNGTSMGPMNFGKGRGHFAGEQGFLGKVDDIGIWNRALTECEILNLFYSQLGGISGSITVSPQSASIGTNVTLSTSTSSQNVQWQTNGGDLGWQNVPSNSTYSGGTSNTVSVNNVQLANHNQPFRVIASSGNCLDTSNIAFLSISNTCTSNVTIYDTVTTNIFDTITTNITIYDTLTTTIYDTTYITVSDTLLTTVTDTLIINTTLSLPAPNNANTIKIYPNPASDHITIDNGNYSAMVGYSIKITNNAGQQVFQSAINQQQFYVDLSTWNGNGLYFVHLFDPQNNTVTVRKIVLQ